MRTKIRKIKTKKRKMRTKIRTMRTKARKMRTKTRTMRTKYLALGAPLVDKIIISIFHLRVSFVGEFFKNTFAIELGGSAVSDDIVRHDFLGIVI